MNKISVIIITKDEEKNILDCLKSVDWADEIIVVDSESTDRTVELQNSSLIKSSFENGKVTFLKNDTL